MAVATLVGNDTYGWIAVASTALIGFVVQQGRGTSQTCAVSPPATKDQSDTDARQLEIADRDEVVAAAGRR